MSPPTSGLPVGAVLRTRLVPPRLDVVRFVVGDRELEIAWNLAVEHGGRLE
jgi:hypothetical protein